MKKIHVILLSSFLVLAMCLTAFSGILTETANALVESFSNVDESEKIILKESSVLVAGNGYIKNLNPQTTVKEIFAEFENSELTIYLANGEKASLEDYVGSGFTVKLQNGAETKDSATFVLKGDVWGDGEITTTDYLLIKSYFYGDSEASDLFLLAGDVDEDSVVDSNDYAKIKAHFLKVYNMFPEKESSDQKEETSESTLGEKRGEKISYSELEKKDLNGREFYIIERWFGYGKDDINFTGEVLYMEDDKGNLTNVNKAKKEIIEQVQKDYNCSINGEIFGEGANNIVSDLRELIHVDVISGTGRYDFFFESYYYYTRSGIDGVLKNLNELEGLNLKSSCWDQNAVEDLSICDYLFYVNGDINTYDNSGTSAMLFNKDLYEELGYTEDLYQLVKERKWTFDKLVELSESFEAIDHNEDGLRDEFDNWFMGSEASNLYVHCVAAGESICTKNENNIPFLTMRTEGTIKALTDAVNFYISGKVLRASDEQYYTKYPGPGNNYKYTVEKSFLDGRELFYMTNLVKVPYFREMEDEFGILPVPLYLNEQDSYYSSMSSHASTSLMVPNSMLADENLGIVIQALAELSEELLTPEYYESLLTFGASKDEESEEMLDIIFNNRHYDLGCVYSNSWNRVDGLYSQLDTNIDNRFKQQEQVISALIESTLEDLKDLKG